MKYLNKIKDIFDKGDVSIIIGYSQGLNTYTTIPVIFRNKFDIDKLVVDCFCNHNLATYIIDTLAQLRNEEKNENKKIGILVKPCDGKSIVELIRENKLSRENLFIYSLPCKGIVDIKKISGLKNKDTEMISSIELFDKKCIINFETRQVDISFNEVVEDKCLNCKLKCSPVYDYLLGECEVSLDKEIDLKNKLKDKNREYWIKEYEKCIRCGACRNVCPMCYCNSCVLERKVPEILRKEVNTRENGMFLMVRAMHLAGRCVQCGRCSEVCPVSIDHKGFHVPVSEYIENTFDFVPGEDNRKPSVFSDAKMEEKEDFSNIINNELSGGKRDE